MVNYHEQRAAQVSKKKHCNQLLKFNIKLADCLL